MREKPGKVRDGFQTRQKVLANGMAGGSAHPSLLFRHVWGTVSHPLAGLPLIRVLLPGLDFEMMKKKREMKPISQTRGKRTHHTSMSKRSQDASGCPYPAQPVTSKENPFQDGSSPLIRFRPGTNTSEVLCRVQREEAGGQCRGQRLE